MPAVVTALALNFFLSWLPQPAFAVGLGKVLTTEDGGQIYGFDIDQRGDDGVLASAQTTDSKGDMLVSVETFDQHTGQITHTFAVYRGMRNSYGVDGIFAGDVGLITHYIVPSGTIYATRTYDVMNPVTAERFTGTWTPPIKDVDIQGAAENQATSTDLLFVIELKNNDRPDLLVSDVATNTFSNVVHLDSNLFGGANGPQLGQYAAANKAVFALSPDAGTVGGQAPLNVLIDMKTGRSSQFSGYNNGYYHAGFVNGLAVDPNTGIAATDTELNAQVEFYDLTKKAGIGFAQLPCSTDVSQILSGSGIAVDPIHKLFLVTETYYCNGGRGSAVTVYDESGGQREVITGFNFALGEPPPALNPSKRMGWAFGGPKGVTQLQQFFY
jgi:hypothetical protein